MRVLVGTSSLLDCRHKAHPSTCAITTCTLTMFDSASAFNQDLAAWNTARVGNMAIAHHDNIGESS
jgi:surface protein